MVKVNVNGHMEYATYKHQNTQLVSDKQQLKLQA